MLDLRQRMVARSLRSVKQTGWRKKTLAAQCDCARFRTQPKPDDQHGHRKYPVTPRGCYSKLHRIPCATRLRLNCVDSDLAERTQGRRRRMYPPTQMVRAGVSVLLCGV